MDPREAAELGMVIRHSQVGTPISDVLPQPLGITGRVGPSTRLPAGVPQREGGVPQFPAVPLHMPDNS